MTNTVSLAFIIFMGIAITPLHAASCSGRITAGTMVSGKTLYNPFSTTPVSDPYEITVVNTGSTPCVFALSISSSGAPETKLGGTLTYKLAGPSDAVISVNHSGAIGGIPLLSPAVAPGMAYIFHYKVLLERGQFASPGTYSQNLDLGLYSFEGGSIKMPRLDGRTLSITYSAPQSLSVNLKGGGLTKTMDFEQFVTGAQRSIAIEARGNMRYQLSVSSAKQGMMTLTPPVTGKVWSIDYVAFLERNSLNLRQKNVIPDLPPTHPRSDAIYNLTVTVGDVSQKRAGRYEDTITIEIAGVKL